jgi:NAD(P)-dependent dehydrogenase (short-subunit alcohol dehydrogenase family)
MELPFKIDLSGKTAVVTGGSGVLCSEFCRALGKCGAKVAIINRSLDKGQKLADEIKAEGGTARAFPADVTDKSSVEAAHSEILHAFGKCDILINGAGGNDPRATTDDEFFDPEVMADPGKKSFFDISAEGFTHVFGLNITGAVLPSQIFGKEMAESGSGAIINISSINSFNPLTKIPAYSSAKAAVSNFTRWLAVYLSKTGVRVNAIAPGFYLTEQNRTLLKKPDGSLTPRSEKILRNTPMGRFGEPSELIGTLLWLCDEKSSGFVTGVVIPVDGGFAAYSGV